MGEYIVPDGKRPLTVNACVTVGPANYELPAVSVYKHHFPEWSIPNRHIYKPVDRDKPGPNAYKPPYSIPLKNNFTLGKRFRISKKVLGGPCKAGPTYKVKGHETGRNSFKYSFPRAARNKIVPGPPNPLLQPQDVLGFKTPGAELFDDTGVRPHSFHANFTTRPTKKSDEFPGPSDYRKPEPDKGPAKSFGLAAVTDHGTYGPGPGKYNLDTLIGKGPAYSITLPKPIISPRRAPSPCAYMREREYDHKEKITMACRLPTPEPATVPAPNAYTIQRDEEREHPWASLKSRTKVPYPAVVHSTSAGEGRSPGPAAHTIRRYPDTKYKAVSLKVRHPAPSDGRRPGPSDHGPVDVDVVSSKTRAPAYTMRALWKLPGEESNPGPAAYKVTPLDPGLAASMKGLRKRTCASKRPMPAPNAYVPKEGCTRTGPGTGTVLGPSLSSRHSPYIYTGLRTTL